MSTLERNLVAVMIVLTFLWSGSLLTAYVLRRPAVVAADFEANVPLAGVLAGGGRAATVAPAVDAFPSADERRERLSKFWSADGAERFVKAPPPSARLVDEPGTQLPAPAAPATLVTLHVKQVSPRVALSALGKQVGARILVYPPEVFSQSTYPTIDVDVDNAPLMEVVGRICGKSGLAFTEPTPMSMFFRGSDSTPMPVGTPDRPLMLLKAQQPGMGPGPRLVAGAFAFELRNIEAARVLGADDTGNAVMLTLAVSYEPQLRVIAQSGPAEVTEATDEGGRSLLSVTSSPSAAPSRAPAVRGGLGAAVASAFGLNPRRARVTASRRVTAQETLDFRLAKPKDAGRKIVTFKAVAKFVVQTKAQSVELPVSVGMPVATKDLGVTQVSVGPLQAQEAQALTCILKYTRGTADDATWQRLQQAFVGNLPSLKDKQGAMALQPMVTQRSEDGNSMTIGVTWRVTSPKSGPNAALDPTSMTLIVPTELAEIAVPIELHDLPLP